MSRSSTSNTRSSADAIDNVLRQLEQSRRNLEAAENQQIQQAVSPLPCTISGSSGSQPRRHRAAPACAELGSGPTQGVISALVELLTKEAHPSNQQLRAVDAYLALQLKSRDDTVVANAPHHPTLDTKIHVTLHGEPVTYDLDALEPEPQGIITLLKLTMSERGAWMTVAAHYRRKKLVSAAIAVVTAMLEMVRNYGIADDDLKPAFILLSACETDLSRDVRCSDRPYHAKNAQKWLRKAMNAPNPNAVPFLLQPRAFQTPKPKPAPASGTMTAVSATSDVKPTTASKTPSQGFSRSDASYQRILERENHSLRDRLDQQRSSLEEMRGLKRRAENELMRERDSLRRAEKRLRVLQDDLDIAKRREGYAVVAQRNEIELRRRAEHAMQREREDRLILENRLRQCRGDRDLADDYADWDPHPRFEV